MKICPLFNSHRHALFICLAGAKIIRALLAIVAVSVAAVQPALCQAPIFPERTVTIVTPYAGGGLSFDFGHLIASRLEQEFRMPVVVEARPGGNSVVGALSVVRSNSDG